MKPFSVSVIGSLGYVNEGNMQVNTPYMGPRSFIYTTWCFIWGAGGKCSFWDKKKVLKSSRPIANHSTKIIYFRWFKVTKLDHLVGGHQQPPLEGSREFTIPKRAPAELPGCFILSPCFEISGFLCQLQWIFVEILFIVVNRSPPLII